MKGPAVAPDGQVANVSAEGDWSIYKRLLRYIVPMWPLFVISLVGFAVGSATEAYFARLFGDVVDDLNTPGTGDWWFYPMAIAVAAIVRAFGEFAGEYFLARVSFRVVHTIRTALFDQLLVMPSAAFDQSASGHLVSRITFNVAQLRDTATDALKIVIQDGSKVIVMVVAMLLASWQLTLIFLAVAPIVGAVVAYASRRFRRISRRIQNSMGDVTHVASEMVNGYRVVRTFGGEDYEQARFHQSSDYNRRQSLKMTATKAWSTQLIQVLVALSLALLIGLLFRPEIAGAMGPGDVVYFVGLAGLLARPMRRLSEVNARLQRGLAAAEDIFAQLDQEAEVDTGTHCVDRAQGRIEFRNVSFSYGRSDEPVLQDIDLVVEPGQTVALVGRSGSGKSTLASLLPRFYDVTSGQILLDGEPLTSYTLNSLRTQVALVTQDVVLFNDTLERNIAYGTLADRAPDDLRNAVVRAHADVFIDQLPEGLDTMVGDNGLLLSGGQRQRVAIARALLKDAPVLILDEATSALDTGSEKHIQEALEEVMRGRTTLVIAHRLSTIESADVIVVVEEGRIVERGTHTELLQQGGHYAALYRAQFSEANDSNADPSTDAANTQPVVTVPTHRSRTNPMVAAWYDNRFWTRLLLPVARFYAWYCERRRFRFLTGQLPRWRAPVPVITLGNAAVGATGKTSLVIWLTQWLREQGWNPGLVTPGSGGNGQRQPLLVSADTPVAVAGDEALILAEQTDSPVVVAEDLVAAAQHLLASQEVDLLISVGGLRRYAMARDIEIAVVDGSLGIGNGHCLPAGPLREPLARLDEVDLVVSNTRAVGLGPTESVLRLRATGFVHVHSGVRRSLQDLPAGRVHAVAAVGNPERLCETLAAIGFEPTPRPFADHHTFRVDDLLFDDDLPVIVTQRDAVKIRELDATALPRACYYLEVDATLDDVGERVLHDCLKVHAVAHSTTSSATATAKPEAGA